MDGVLKANALEPLKVDLGGGGEHIYIYVYTLLKCGNADTHLSLSLSFEQVKLLERA